MGDQKLDVMIGAPSRALQRHGGQAKNGFLYQPPGSGGYILTGVGFRILCSGPRKCGLFSHLSQ